MPAYNLVPSVCLKFSMLVAIFAASIYENVCVELCRVEKCCCWRCSVGLTPGRLRHLGMETLLSVAVLIFEVQFERILCNSRRVRWLHR